ncbi:unnamed protein product, partial [Rotaria sordida]
TVPPADIRERQPLVEAIFRQLIDKVDYQCNAQRQDNFKYFLLLVHSPAQTIYHQSSFPSIFLHNWDFHFFDTCLSNNSFYIENFIQILTSSCDNRVKQNDNQMLCDYNVLFDDCLWDFCSRIQIVLQQLPRDLFRNRCAYEFYQRQTSTFRRVQSPENDIREHYYAVPDEDAMNNANENKHSIEELRFELIKAIEKDPVLMKIVNKSVLKTYSSDLIQTFCMIVEKNFTDDRVECQNSIEFVSRWLSLVDENEQRILDEYRHEDIWRLAHVFTSFEYNRNDLFSLYSACRIMDRLDQTRTFYQQLFDDDNPIRSLVRERLFRRMFDDLWKSLLDVCFNGQAKETWILCCTMISKYYPSSKVLEQTQLIDIKSHIEFINFAHFILLNENIEKPEELVAKLLQQFKFLQQNELNYHGGQKKSPYIERYPSIIETVNNYITEKDLPKSTLMIDVQQWIISILKSTNDSYREEICLLFKYLNQPTCPLILAIKEFLFDELASIYLKYTQQNQMIKDTWDRIILLPTMIQCASNENPLENYHLPYHPSVVNPENTRSALLDLFFSHLKRLMTDEVAHWKLINKIMQSTVPPADIRERQPLVEAIFRQIKDYFLIQLTALLLCETHHSVEDRADVNRLLLYMINNYLSIQNNATKLSEPLQNFLSAIVSKFSWNHLLKVLKSHDVQQQNQQWSTTLSRFFENRQATVPRQSSLQMSHQLEFTLASNNEQSIFPHLQQPYEELKRIVDECVNQNNDEQRWKPFTDWIALNRQENPPKLQLIEIKVIVLLNIYYEYLCQDRLQLIDSLLPIIEKDLDLLVEERLVFRALSQPERSMIGYPTNPQDERNTLNDFFTSQCHNEDELRIRHCLVNLMAMILLGGKQSFLWSFAFQPLSLIHTHGFGTTAQQPIEELGVHYDCGCVIDEKGELLQFSGRSGPLNVPGIYVAYFSTFGAMVN